MRVVFMGSSQASATTLRAILKSTFLKVVGVVTQPDRPSGRHRKMTPCPCKAYAEERKLSPIITPEKVNAPEVVEQIRALKPDVIVVVAFGQILKKELLEMAPHGCINGHFSLLPKHRGAAPVQDAILSGDKVTGVTIMRMDEQMDTGDILLTAIEPICSDDSAGELMDRLAILGAVTMSKALKMMVAGMLKRTPQDHSQATYSKKMLKSDGLIDWNLPADEINRKVRAFDPWPGAYTFREKALCRPGTSGRVKILDAHPVLELEETFHAVAPGTICAISPIGPVVKAGQGVVTLLSIQPDGGRPMDGKSFLNGYPMRVGDRFVSNPEA
ncbi:MAG: methionyl-tRNA formyltransferase [Kiritimatiellae bacterium]|nr:methionyl-tRNA formyltransferase [Kiritimatiellia bacterium]